MQWGTGACSNSMER